MINGFDSFPRGCEPLRYHFFNDGDHWFAEIGFTGSPLGDEVHAVIQFTPVGADALPSYYCRTLTDRTALAPLRLRRDAPEATVTEANMAAILSWMRSTPRTVLHGTPSDAALYLDGTPAPSLRAIERALSAPDGFDRVRWFDGARMWPVVAAPSPQLRARIAV
jgi:hypothetical protein